MAAWIQFQIVLLIFLIGISFIIPKKLFKGIIILTIIFTAIAVFTKWLFVIQFVNIGICYKIGESIIRNRNKMFGIDQDKIDTFIINHPKIASLIILLIILFMIPVVCNLFK